jgi:hypothetical protein
MIRADESMGLAAQISRGRGRCRIVGEKPGSNGVEEFSRPLNRYMSRKYPSDRKPFDTPPRPNREDGNGGTEIGL